MKEIIGISILALGMVVSSIFTIWVYMGIIDHKPKGWKRALEITKVVAGLMVLLCIWVIVSGAD